MNFQSARTALRIALVLLTGTAGSMAQEAKLAPALQPFVDNHTLPGAVVLVADKDKILDLEAVGFSDVAAQKPMPPDALFWIASMTKSITCTLMMMLVDEGKVNVDDPVEKYLPEFKDQQVAVKQETKTANHPGGAIQGYMIPDEKLGANYSELKKATHMMTVRDLLTHTSGMSPIKTPRQIAEKDLLPLADAVKGYATLPLKFEPGTKYEYSNHGIDTAGRIIEIVSGMSYADFMEQRLLQPLGMKDTTFWPSDEQVARLAKAYDAAAAQKGILTDVGPNGLFTYPLSNPRRQPMPSGGLFSTATDISIFCRMLLNGGVYEGRRYLSLQSLRQMTSTQTGDILNKGLNEDGYGFGWQTSRKLHPTDRGLAGPFGHGGAYGTEMAFDPRHSLVSIFMVQFQGGLLGDSGRQIKTAFNKAVSATFRHPKQPPQ